MQYIIKRETGFQGKDPKYLYSDGFQIAWERSKDRATSFEHLLDADILANDWTTYFQTKGMNYTCTVIGDR